MLADFHFLRPECFWALIPLAGILLWAQFRKLHKGNWSRVVEPQLQNHVLMQSQTNDKNWSSLLFAIGGLLAIIAMAGPAWEKLPLPVFKDETALVIALDLSKSMDAQDLKPSRLQRARLKLIDILRKRKTGQTALITFAAEAFIVTPLTDDVETIITHVPNLTTDLMPSQGSRADIAIEKALQLLKQTGIPKGEILLLTDGADAKKLKEAAANVRENGHQLSIMGIGTTAGAPIPAYNSGFLKDPTGGIVIAKLDENALKGHGLYHRITNDDQDVNYLVDKNAPELLELQHKPTELKTDTWQDQGPWLLLPLLLLVPLGFRRGVLILATLCLLPLPFPAQAFSWKDLWLNNNQRAAQELNTGNASQAAKLFNDPEWQAAAHYRAEEYEQAVAALESAEGIEALYNKGNALAKLGKIPEAITSYEEVLKLNPKHEDARHNRDLLKQQQQDQQQSNQNQDEQQNQEQQNSQQQDSSQQSEQQQSEQQQSEQGQSDQQQTEQNSDQQQSDESKQNVQQQQAEDSEKEESQQAQSKQNEQEKSEQEQQQTAQAMSEESAEPDAEQQAIEQWLRRVPDDPGGLLRRKFQHQYRQQRSRGQESQQW